MEDYKDGGIVLPLAYKNITANRWQSSSQEAEKTQMRRIQQPIGRSGARLQAVGSPTMHGGQGTTADGSLMRADRGATVDGSLMHGGQGTTAGGSLLRADRGATGDGSLMHGGQGTTAGGSLLRADRGATVDGSLLPMGQGRSAASFAEKIIGKHSDFQNYDEFYRHLVFLDSHERQVISQNIIRQTIQQFYRVFKTVYYRYFHEGNRVTNQYYFSQAQNRYISRWSSCVSGRVRFQTEHIYHSRENIPAFQGGLGYLNQNHIGNAGGYDAIPALASRAFYPDQNQTEGHGDAHVIRAITNYFFNPVITLLHRLYRNPMDSKGDDSVLFPTANYIYRLNRNQTESGRDGVITQFPTGDTYHLYRNRTGNYDHGNESKTQSRQGDADRLYQNRGEKAGDHYALGSRADRANNIFRDRTENERRHYINSPAANLLYRLYRNYAEYIKKDTALNHVGYIKKNTILNPVTNYIHRSYLKGLGRFGRNDAIEAYTENEAPLRQDQIIDPGHHSVITLINRLFRDQTGDPGRDNVFFFTANHIYRLNQNQGGSIKDRKRSENTGDRYVNITRSGDTNNIYRNRIEKAGDEYVNITRSGDVNNIYRNQTANYGDEYRTQIRRVDAGHLYQNHIENTGNHYAVGSQVDRANNIFQSLTGNGGHQFTGNPAANLLYRIYRNYAEYIKEADALNHAEYIKKENVYNPITNYIYRSYRNELGRFGSNDAIEAYTENEAPLRQDQIIDQGHHSVITFINRLFRDQTGDPGRKNVFFPAANHIYRLNQNQGGSIRDRNRSENTGDDRAIHPRASDTNDRYRSLTGSYEYGNESTGDPAANLLYRLYRNQMGSGRDRYYHNVPSTLTASRRPPAGMNEPGSSAMALRRPPAGMNEPGSSAMASRQPPAGMNGSEPSVMTYRQDNRETEPVALTQGQGRPDAETSAPATMVYRQAKQGGTVLEKMVHQEAGQLKNLQAQVKRTANKLSDEEVIMRENARQIRKLEQTISKQEEAIQALKKQIEAAGEQDETRREFDSITPEFRRDWELEKMRYGLA